MRKILYNRILDNCKFRTSCDIVSLERYMRKYTNWEEFLIQRHKKILRKYIETDGSIREISEMLNCSRGDVGSILLRIQSQFEMYDKSKDKNIIFVESNEEYRKIMLEKYMELNRLRSEMALYKKEISLLKNKEDMIIKVKKEPNIEEIFDSGNSEKIVEDKVVTKDCQQEYTDTIKEEKNRLLKYTIDILKRNRELAFNEVLTKKMKLYAEDLLEGKSIEEISKKYNITEKYLMTIVVGTPQGTRKSTKGFVKLIEEYRMKRIKDRKLI